MFSHSCKIAKTKANLFRAPSIGRKRNLMVSDKIGKWKKKSHMSGITEDNVPTKAEA